MASNQLTELTRRAIQNEVSIIFGRAIEFFRFPLTTIAERTTLARCCYSDEFVNHIAEVVRCDDPTDSILVSHTGILVSLQLPEGMQVKLHLRSDDTDDEQPDYVGVTGYGTKVVTWPVVVERLGRHKADALFTWVSDVVSITEDIKVASRTLKELIEMARTPGQLRRMIPELVACMPLRLQKELAPQGQQRASSVPFEWSSFPRASVEHATTVLAKCKLLPSEGSQSWEDACNATWIAAV